MKFFSRTSLIACLVAAVIPAFADSTANPLADFENFSETRALVRNAEEALSRENYKAAAKNYRKAAKIQSNEGKRAEFLYLEAQNLLRAGKPHDALDAYRNLLDEHLYNIPLENVLDQLRTLAEDFENGRGTFLGISNPEAAINIYTIIIRYEAGIQQSLGDRLALAAKYEKAKKVEEAVETYQQIIKLAPDDAETRLRLARLLDRESAKRDSDGHLGKAAIREANSFLQQAPKDDERRDEARKIIQDAREREAARLLERAQFYLNKHHYRPQTARRYLLDLNRDYHDTKAGADAKSVLDEQFPENAD